MRGASTPPLLAYYGDDFTGSTDVLEAFAFGGCKAVLFTGLPTPDDLSRFAGYQVVGIAGVSRAHSPEWMDENLPSVFQALSATGAKVVQYKVCSTFDSTPAIGSIGRAIDIGMSVTGSDWAPCVVGVPSMRRWQIFGHLFAGDGEGLYRIDRHPTMSRHPVTPMLESDLRVHLGRQTDRPIGLIVFTEVGTTVAQSKVDQSRLARGILFIDVSDDATQIAAARLVWNNAGRQLFSASSSGLDHGLVKHWREEGLVEETPLQARSEQASDGLLVLSGSCSPMTARQIACAERSGFASTRLDAASVLDAAARQQEIARLRADAAEAIRAGRSAIVYTARSTDDPAFAEFDAQCRSVGTNPRDGQRALGAMLGEVCRGLVSDCGIKRVLVAGGDTSGAVVQHLPIHALEALRPLAQGAPLCVAHSRDPDFQGLRIILKGGQIGDEGLFEAARHA